LLILLVGPASGISAARPPERAASLTITLDMNTVRLDGWLSARAVLMLNSAREHETFNPFGKEEGQRCAPIVNDTGARTKHYARFDGKRVIVTGFAIRYDDLPVGNTVADQALTRRYYKGQQVHNFCFRELVFVARKIILKD
jgi:hypothetical protein